MSCHVQTEEGKFAVCNNCGQMSADYNVCDGCNRVLPLNPKYFVPDTSKALKVNSGEKVLSKQTFYGGRKLAIKKGSLRPAARAAKKPAEPGE